MRDKQIMNLLEDLVKIQSDTGTSKEVAIENFIYDFIREIDFFQQNPHFFGKCELQNDPLNRSIVWALRKGNGDKTIILLHHHDIVDSYDYGRLQQYAYNPKLLKEELKSADINQDTKEDLESGEWMFGRGTADMKAGAAIHLTLLKEYSNLENFKGNILLLSVPDEESLSQGARESAKLIKNLKDKYNLKLRLCIDGEPHERPNKDTSIYYEGSVGKTMVVVYVRGKKTHLGHIYEGLNPSHILSQIVVDTDMNTVFSDRVEQDVSPPPSWSFMRDTKEQYDASIPESAGGYFSVLTLSTSPKEILEKTKELCERAFEKVVNRVQCSFDSYNKIAEREAKKLPWKENVLLFSEAFEQAKRDNGDRFLEAYDIKVASIKNDLKNGVTNIPNSTLDLLATTIDYIEDKAPKVIIAFSPPYYPHIANLDFKNLDNEIKNIGQDIEAFAKEKLGQTYSRNYYFMGISDLSYVALNDSESVVPYISPNMPHWDKTYSMAFEQMKEISVPVLNIGPWGKDYHKFSERVYIKDVIENTPKLTEFIINKLLNA